MKNYWLLFGSGDPAVNSGLTPTFTLFFDYLGNTLTPPGITEPLAGSGYYLFQYAATLSIAFLADGGAQLGSDARYVRGNLDPIQSVDQKVGAITDSFGDNLTDPTTIFGFVKRIDEFLEGDQQYLKASGIWNIYSRAGASGPLSGTLLREKTLSNDSTEVTRE